VAFSSALHPKSLQSPSFTVNFLSGEVAVTTSGEAVAIAANTLQTASTTSAIRLIAGSTITSEKLA